MQNKFDFISTNELYYGFTQSTVCERKFYDQNEQRQSETKDLNTDLFKNEN